MHFHRSYAIGFLTSSVVGAALLSGRSAVAGPLWTFNAAMCVPMDLATAAQKPQVLSAVGGQLVQNVPTPNTINMLCPLPYETVGGVPQVQGRKPTMNGWGNNRGVDFLVCRTNLGGGGGECGGSASGSTGNYSLTLSDTTAWFDMTPGDALYVQIVMGSPDSSGSNNTLFSYWY
jgi:hypothetical protein